MFELALCFPVRQGSDYSESIETITAGHIPQIGSTIHVDIRRHYGTWEVESIAQSVTDGVLESRIYVHLKESE
jgi:hypothetical protein